MKILQIGKFYPPKGGIELSMFFISEELNNRGINCEVLTVSTDNKSGTIYDFSSKIILCKKIFKISSMYLSLEMIFKLRKIIKSYDLIQIHHPDPMAALALLFSDYKGKRIVTYWHSDIVRQKLLLKLYLPIQSWLLKRSDLIITTTPNYLFGSKYLKNYLIKATSIPSGIKPIFCNNVVYSELKKKYSENIIIFSLGRLVYYKGFEYLILSANYLPDNYKIIIGGEGPLRNKLVKLINKEGLNKKVELLGRIKDDDVGAYYKICTIFCLPSIEKSEAFGLVQVEAMSFGKPVVSTKIVGSGIDWVNINNETGKTVEPKNPREIALAITSIVENDNLYYNYSKNALKRYMNEFTIIKQVDRLLNAYNNLNKYK